MKKWLLLLALSLVFTGCNGDKKDDQARTQSKQDKEMKSPKLQKMSAIKRLGSNKYDLVLFLNRAEHLFDDVYYSAASMSNGKFVRDDGVVYRQLPRKWDSKEKLIGYFSQYWSRPIAVNMYDNLNTKIVNGIVYVAVPQTDYPVLISVRNTTLEKDKRGITATVTNVTNPGYARDRNIRYRLVPDAETKRFEIKSRAGAYGSEMYH